MTNVFRRVRPHALWLAVAAIMLLLAGFAVLASIPAPAEAAKGGTCASFVAYNSADRAVSADDQVFRPETDRTISPRNFMLVRGRYVDFDVNLSNFTVLDYTLTSPLSRGVRTEIFARKVPQTEPLSGRLALRVVREHIRMERGTGQSIKIQAKDCQQGGIFQMEPEPGTRETNTLGEGFAYEPGTPGQDGPLCFTNGRVNGYDSPEVATLVSSTARTATWNVAAGGRIGMVVGEDATEAGCLP